MAKTPGILRSLAGGGIKVVPTGASDSTGLMTATGVAAFTGAEGDGATVLEGTDYEVLPEGIFIPANKAIGNNSPVSISYSYWPHRSVEALTKGSQVFELSFGGMNEANSNSPVILDIYKLQISAAKTLSFLGDDFAELELTGKVLMDQTKSGTGISKYFRVQMT